MELNGRPLRVLVVEDNPADFVLLRETLLETPVQLGELVNAGTFDEAALLLRDSKFDLVFLDLSLPDTSVPDTFSSIKPYCDNCPVIILSGMTDLELARKMIEEGAQDYLLKDNLDIVTLTKAVFYSIERARYNEKLRESEERYRDLFDMNPIPVYFYDEDTLRIIRANQAAQVYYGYSEEEFANMPMLNMRSPGEEKDFFERVKETRNQKGLVFAGQWAFQKKDGTRVEMEIHTRMIREGQRTFRLVAAYDVTEKQRTLEKLHFQSRVLENITDGVIVCELDGKIISWNKAAVEIYGSTEEEMIGRGLDALRADKKDDSDLSKIISRLNAAGSIEFVTRHHTRDQRIIWVELKVTYNYDVSRNITGLIVVCRDITDLKAEEHLLKLFQSVILNANDAVIITEALPPEGEVARKIVFVNEAFTKTTGYRADEIIGKTMFSLAGPLTSDVEVRRILDAMLRWEMLESEIVYYKKDGGAFWVNVTLMPVSDHSGHFTHWVFIQRDVTEARRAAEKLREQNEALTKTNRELDRFVYSASHDLRAPLTSVLGLVNLMRKDSFGNTASIYLDKIQESIQRLDKLIQNIINYSRNSRLQPKVSGIDFREIFDDTVSMHKFMYEAQRIRFDFQSTLTETFYSDPERWQIILNNLVSNSIKFARPGVQSYIRLNVKQENDELVLVFEDNGIGIPTEQMGSIFEMFYRATTYSPGSGLGLYIVKQTVELLGGSIRAESVPSEYTRFIIRMPFAILPEVNYAQKSNRTT